MEKRVYTPGYHTEWNKSKYNPDKQELAGKTRVQNQILMDRQSKKVTNTIDTSFDQIITDNIIALEGNKHFVLPKEKFNLFLNQIKKVPAEEKKIEPICNSGFEKNSKITLSAADETDISVMALAGFICSGVGFLLLISYGWPFFLGTLGVIFSAIGMAKTGKDKKKGKIFAIAGLLLGILVIVLFWQMIIGLFAANI